jgi:hypothetical protein
MGKRKNMNLHKIPHRRSPTDILNFADILAQTPINWPTESIYVNMANWTRWSVPTVSRHTLRNLLNISAASGDTFIINGVERIIT